MKHYNPFINKKTNCHCELTIAVLIIGVLFDYLLIINHTTLIIIVNIVYFFN